MNKLAELERITVEIKKCSGCKKSGSGLPVPGEGNPDADIIFIGEAPGKEEAKTGKPFVGRSGQLLRKLIRDIGLKEEDIYITSPVKYLPKRGTPNKKDINHGRIHLEKQLAVINPKIIVLLGNAACQAILGKTTQVTKNHGQVIITSDNRKHLITFHPAAAIRFPKKIKPLFKEDFQKLEALISR